MYAKGQCRAKDSGTAFFADAAVSREEAWKKYGDERDETPKQ